MAPITFADVLLAIPVLLGGLALLVLLCCSRLARRRYQGARNSLLLRILRHSSSDWPLRRATEVFIPQGTLWLPFHLRGAAQSVGHPCWRLTEDIQEADLILLIEPSTTLTGLLHARLLIPARKEVLQLPDILPENQDHPSLAPIWTELARASLVKTPDRFPQISPDRV